ncbi:MAG: hypothetical protein V5783_05990 [Pontiella sp.]
MNLSHLTKEQKIYMALGAIALIGIGVGIVMGVQYWMSSIQETKTELADLNLKIDRTERLLFKTAESRTNFEQTIRELERDLDYVPPEQNYYSWATEIIYSKSREAGLEIESVDEVAVSGAKRGAALDPVYFELYSLRIIARGGFEQTKLFLRNIEENHPLVRVYGLEFSTGGTPDEHRIQLFVQWPFRMNRLRRLWEDRPRYGNSAGINVEADSNSEPIIKTMRPIL